MGVISVSLVLNSVEYIDAAKYNVKKYFLSSVQTNQTWQLPSSVKQHNVLHPVTSITLDGEYTDATELNNLYEALKTAAVRVPTNNTFEMLEDSVAVFSENVLVADFKVQSDAILSANKWSVVMTLVVHE